MKKFALILNGCGSMDGSEIHESVSAMYAIDKHGAEYRIFAPDMDQYEVIDHRSKTPMPEKRNCLTEAARIARGNVQPLSALHAEDFDALLFPGGSGSAKNIFSYLYEGEHFHVNEDIAAIIRAFHRAGKPIGAMCIAPLMIARVIEGVTVTMGQHAPTSKLVEQLGGHALPTRHGEVIHDLRNKVFSVPCYMLDARISDIFEEASHLVEAMLQAMNETTDASKGQ
ncbi:MAG: isoprenoid biosynthesis glyoxalase ElbB [Bacteroidales bacterium]|nr:isoprenoid biosynthesis glyoxalase ElbB [Bacteroidales bacterium]